MIYIYSDVIAVTFVRRQKCGMHAFHTKAREIFSCNEVTVAMAWRITILDDLYI